MLISIFLNKTNFQWKNVRRYMNLIYSRQMRLFCEHNKVDLANEMASQFFSMVRLLSVKVQKVISSRN